VSCGHESLPRNSSENFQADANAIICFRVDCTAEFSDLWSVAYHEAVTSLGEEVKGRIMNDEKIDELFAILEEKNDQSARDSLFRRGSRKLRLPLENFKLALDIASPLASIALTASTAVGVVKSVTAVRLPTLIGAAKFRSCCD
jgi:hypothetical protein